MKPTTRLATLAGATAVIATLIGIAGPQAQRCKVAPGQSGPQPSLAATSVDYYSGSMDRSVVASEREAAAGP
jgi:hypothetical protein